MRIDACTRWCHSHVTKQMYKRIPFFACLIVAITAALASAPHAQQAPPSGLSWQQRFLGILPLVKPDPKDPIVVTVNGTPITVADVKDYAKTEQRLINANNENIASIART